MPFVKGQSGNPGGRPKDLVDVIELARQKCPDAVLELARIASGGKSEQARVAACNSLLDRGYGKPAQQIQHADADGNNLPAMVTFQVVAHAAKTE